MMLKAIAHIKDQSYLSDYEVIKEIKSISVWGLKRGNWIKTDKL